MAAYKGCLEQSLLQQDNTNNKQLTGKAGESRASAGTEQTCPNFLLSLQRLIC